MAVFKDNNSKQNKKSCICVKCVFVRVCVCVCVCVYECACIIFHTVMDTRMAYWHTSCTLGLSHRAQHHWEKVNTLHCTHARTHTHTQLIFQRINASKNKLPIQIHNRLTGNSPGNSHLRNTLLDEGERGSILFCNILSRNLPNKSRDSPAIPY